jgi:hypothetical protein
MTARRVEQREGQFLATLLVILELQAGGGHRIITTHLTSTENTTDCRLYLYCFLDQERICYVFSR